MSYLTADLSLFMSGLSTSVVDKVASVVAVAARSFAPKDSGELVRKIRVYRYAGRVFVRSTAPHAFAIEYGKGAFILTPKNKKALAFVVNGEFVITGIVRHPGNAPRPYMAPAIRVGKRAVIGIFKQEVAKYSVLSDLRSKKKKVVSNGKVL